MEPTNEYTMTLHVQLPSFAEALTWMERATAVLEMVGLLEDDCEGHIVTERIPGYVIVDEWGKKPTVHTVDDVLLFEDSDLALAAATILEEETGFPLEVYALMPLEAGPWGDEYVEVFNVH